MKNDSFSQINVVPLVDILLVLIVITLMTASFIVQGTIKVNLPNAEKKEEISKDVIRLVLNEEGKLFFHDKELEVREIPVILYGVNRDSPILVSADRNVKLQPFITVFESIKKAGFNSVSVHAKSE